MLREIEALVQGAVGYDQARGDKIAVAARPFAAVEVAKVAIWQEPVVVESSKWLAAALVAIAILAFVIRPVLRRIAEPLGDRKMLTGPDGQPLLPSAGEPRLIDYREKLAEARLLASTDAARATAVARRLLAEPEL
jgi:flagellar M-ring protein FliF